MIAISVYHNYANAELEKVAGNLKDYEVFREYMYESQFKGNRSHVLPRHVIENF